MTITIEQAKIFEALLIQNRDSAKLQKITNCSYLESIEHLNDIRKKYLSECNNQNNNTVPALIETAKYWLKQGYSEAYIQSKMYAAKDENTGILHIAAAIEKAKETI